MPFYRARWRFMSPTFVPHEWFLWLMTARRFSGGTGPRIRALVFRFIQRSECDSEMRKNQVGDHEAFKSARQSALRRGSGALVGSTKQSSAAAGLDHDQRARAERAGLKWAECWFERVGREQRAVSGGWPGTMSEARAQVVQLLLPWLRRQGKWPVHDVTDFEAMARLVYSTARAAWRERAVPERDLPMESVPCAPTTPK